VGILTTLRSSWGFFLCSWESEKKKREGSAAGDEREQRLLARSRHGGRRPIRDIMWRAQFDRLCSKGSAERSLSLALACSWSLPAHAFWCRSKGDETGAPYGL
jgi:hypothetical protein